MNSRRSGATHTPLPVFAAVRSVLLVVDATNSQAGRLGTDLDQGARSFSANAIG
jgi:hypothetical protein